MDSSLRTAAQQALEALGSPLYPQPRQMAAIAALKAALAEPVQDGKCQLCVDGCPACDARKLAEPTVPSDCADSHQPVQEPVFELGFGWLDDATKYPRGTKLYAAPPQRKPLPASEIVTMYDESPRGDSDMIDFARAIERAHGIGCACDDINGGKNE